MTLLEPTERTSADTRTDVRALTIRYLMSEEFAAQFGGKIPRWKAEQFEVSEDLEPEDSELPFEREAELRPAG